MANRRTNLNTNNPTRSNPTRSNPRDFGAVYTSSRGRPSPAGRYDGNLAYDLEAPALYPDYTIAPPAADGLTVEMPAPPAPREQTAPRERQAFAPGAILGTLCACVLLVMMIMSQIQLTQLSSDTVSLQNRVYELKLEETRLKIAYESAFNLTEVEQYAMLELGMQKPRSEQVFYIDGTAPDKAVIHGTSHPVSGVSGLNGLVDKVKGFFG